MWIMLENKIMKIAVYGTGKVAQGFCDRIEDVKDIKILYFVQTKKTEDYFRNKKVVLAEEIDYSEIDYLIIASNIYYEEIMKHLMDINDNYELYKYKIKKAREWITEIWENVQNYMPFASCKVAKDITYISSSEDDGIGGAMFKSGRNLSDDMIRVFFELTEKYYKNTKRSEEKYFLDIGANIGTTSIYVKKKINEKLRIIGFEAGRFNYDLFRVNCILNQVEDIKVELLGLSDSNTRKKYRYVAFNSGGSGITGDGAVGSEISTIETMKLDDYLDENHISADKIAYIWMDTEGHEYEIITGGFKTLQVKKIPLLQEFNATHYIGSGNLESYCQKIEVIYDYFLDVHEYMSGKINIIPIVKIYDFAKNMEKIGKAQTDLFFL